MPAEQLLVGARSIASALGLRPRLVYDLAEKGRLPTFRLGQRIVAAPSMLDEWRRKHLAEAERKASI